MSAYGYGLFTGGLGVDYGAEALGGTVIPMSGGQTERQVELILDFEPDIIMVTPSYMLCLLDEFRERGIDPRSSSLKIGIFAQSPGPKRCEENRAGCSGSTQWISTACRRRWGQVSPRKSLDQGRAERFGKTILSRDRSIPRAVKCFPDGSEGELVFTSSTKQAMPVVRYRTRDLTRLLSAQIHDAPDGEDHWALGRDADHPRGDLFPSQIEEKPETPEARASTICSKSRAKGDWMVPVVYVENQLATGQPQRGRGFTAHQGEHRCHGRVRACFAR